MLIATGDRAESLLANEATNMRLRQEKQSLATALHEKHDAIAVLECKLHERVVELNGCIAHNDTLRHELALMTSQRDRANSVLQATSQALVEQTALVARGTTVQAEQLAEIEKLKEGGRTLLEIVASDFDAVAEDAHEIAVGLEALIDEVRSNSKGTPAARKKLVRSLSRLLGLALNLRGQASSLSSSADEESDAEPVEVDDRLFPGDDIPVGPEAPSGVELIQAHNVTDELMKDLGFTRDRDGTLRRDGEVIHGVIRLT
jgi:hypothetical protein